MAGEGMKWIGAGVSIILLIIIISTHLFSFWVFIGFAVYIMLFMGGWFWIKARHEARLEDEASLNARKKKFDWCWEHANAILERMPNGQPIQWDRGISRRSEYKTFHDGIQNRPFRSLVGYTGEQTMVVVIYDIDNDDIVRFVTDPSTDIIMDHFSGFKPFPQRMSSGMGGYRYDRRGRRYPVGYRTGRGVNISIGDEGGDGGEYSDLDGYASPNKPSQDAVNSAVDKLENG